MRNASWIEDEALKDDLEKYVKQDLRINEILDFVRRDLTVECDSLMFTTQTNV